MPFSVRLTGVEDAQQQLSPSAPQDALQAVIEQLADELSTPKGGGLGVQVNSLMQNVDTGLAIVESSLIWPRTTGESWLARSQQEGESIAIIALDAAGEKLAQEMA